MRPIQARLTFISFLAVVGGITYNALYYQDPDFALRAEQQNSKTVATSKIIPKTTGSVTDSIGPADTEMQAQSGVSGVVAAIQRELKVLGYYPGPEDGAAGLLTRASIMAFEHDRGLVLTGEPTDDVLKKIIFGIDKNANSFSDQQTVSATSKKIVAVVQTVLSDLGYAPGTVDGVLKEETKKAISAFEKDRKLKASGRISGQLIKELMSVTDIATGGSGSSSQASSNSSKTN